MSYLSEVLADSPRGYWRLGEASGTTAVDEAVNQDGVYTNGVTLGATSLLPSDADTAASFDGTDDFVIMAGTGHDFEITGAITLEAWIKPTVVNLTEQFIVGCYDGTSNGGFWISLRSQKLRIHIRGSGTNASLDSGNVISAGSTYHVVGTYDDATNTATLYVNGVQVAQNTSFTQVLGALTNRALYIGRRSGAEIPFGGVLDEVAVYPAVLTSTRVAAHYDAGTQTGQTLDLGKVASGAAVRGVDLTAAGPITLDLGNVPSGAAVRGVDLSAAGPITLSLGKVPSGEAVRGVDLAGAVLTLELGKVGSGQAVRGIDLAAAGPLTLDLGKTASGATVRGIDLTQSGPITLDLGKVAGGAAVRGVDLATTPAGTLALGKIPSDGAVRGIDLTQAGPVTVALGKVPSGAAVRGVDLTQSGPITLSLGNVPGGVAVRGINLTQSGPVTLDLGRVPTGQAVRGITFSLGTIPVARFVTMSDTATATVALTERAGSVELTDSAGSVTLTETPT